MLPGQGDLLMAAQDADDYAEEHERDDWTRSDFENNNICYECRGDGSTYSRRTRETSLCEHCDGTGEHHTCPVCGDVRVMIRWATCALCLAPYERVPQLPKGFNFLTIAKL